MAAYSREDALRLLDGGAFHSDADWFRPRVPDMLKPWLQRIIHWRLEQRLVRHVILCYMIGRHRNFVLTSFLSRESKGLSVVSVLCLVSRLRLSCGMLYAHAGCGRRSPSSTRAWCAYSSCEHNPTFRRMARVGGTLDGACA